MTYSLPHPEPAEALAFDLVRAQLDGDRGTVATLVADASQTPRRLIAVLASTAQIAIELGRHAHGGNDKPIWPHCDVLIWPHLRACGFAAGHVG